MANVRAHLLQHLVRLAAAYGDDAPVAVARPPASRVGTGKALGPAAPAGAARPRATPSAPAAKTPSPARAVAAPAPAPLAPAPAAAPTGDREPALHAVCTEVLACTKCKLHGGRRNAVFGEGSPHARVLFVGEAPGAEEDRTGRPFVGPAGQLLDKIIAGAMGLRRADVYIANINKCRPPDNRAPEADEVAACLPYLHRQVEILRPEVIVCLGRTAAQNLLATTASTTQLRGKTHSFHGVPVIVTWHPAYLLRDPSHKGETWEDIKRVNRLLGLPEVPGKPAGKQP